MGFFVRRWMQGLGVLWGALTLVFILFALVPDPARQLAGQQEREETVAAIRAKLGLDQSLGTRYVHFMVGLSPWQERDGHWGFGAPDLGRSWISERPVTEAIVGALPSTLLLACLAMTLALALGMFGGILTALHVGSVIDRWFLGIAALGMSAPSFVVAIIFSWLFGSLWHRFTGLPMTGGLWEIDPFEGPQLAWKNAVLPALTLGVRPLSVVFQLTRNSAADVLAAASTRTARSKGISTRRLLAHHVFRNALNPVITAASGWFASMLAGAVFIEFVFGWQGMGLLMFRALEQSDLPMVMGCVAVVASIFVVVNALVDVLYAWVDPRVRITG